MSQEKRETKKDFFIFRKRRFSRKFRASSFFLLVFFLAFSIFPLSTQILNADGVNLTVTIIGDKECNDGIDNDGDGKIDYPDDPGCSSETDDDETDPATSPPSGGGGGGGGGGGSGIIPSSSLTTVIFKGQAYPSSEVTLLQDAQVVATTKAGPDAQFEIQRSGLSAGSYTFGVWAEDSKGVRSITHTFTISVTSGVTTSVSGIFIPPTISVDKSEVRRGDVLKILGQGTPNAEVTISINSEHEIIERVSSDNTGVWLYNLDTLRTDFGSHTARARLAKNQEISSFSSAVIFKVGTKNVLAETPTKIEKGDVNNDNKVNLIDFSIAAYWFKRPSPPASSDLNSDGVVNLIDLSILAFYWTG